MKQNVAVIIIGDTFYNKLVVCIKRATFHQIYIYKKTPISIDECSSVLGVEKLSSLIYYVFISLC